MQKTADRFHDWLIKVSEIIHVMMERFLQLQYEAFPLCSDYIRPSTMGRVPLIEDIWTSMKKIKNN